MPRDEPQWRLFGPDWKKTLNDDGDDVFDSAIGHLDEASYQVVDQAKEGDHHPGHQEASLALVKGGGGYCHEDNAAIILDYWKEYNW